jgi:hypothetical protein
MALRKIHILGIILQSPLGCIFDPVDAIVIHRFRLQYGRFMFVDPALAPYATIRVCKEDQNEAEA